MDEKPKVQKILTEDGWDYIADYGKQGVSVAHVHIQKGTPEDVARNRAALDRVLNEFGYSLKE